MAFAKSGKSANFPLLAINDDGSELIYQTPATLLTSSALCRDQDGIRTSVELGSPQGKANWLTVFATRNKIVVFDGAEFSFFDTSGFVKIGSAKVSEFNVLATKLVVSKNQKYLFCNSQGETPDGYFLNSHILDLNDGKITWSVEPFVAGQCDRYFDTAENEIAGFNYPYTVANTIVESIADSANKGQFLPVATYSFETGVLKKIQSGACIPYLSSDGKRSITEIPGPNFKLSNQGKELVLNATPSASPLGAAISEDRILLEQDQVFKLFNWRSMEIENTFKLPGDWSSPRPVLSPNGETFAVHVRK